jgi:hypothetical protein
MAPTWHAAHGCGARLSADPKSRLAGLQAGGHPLESDQVLCSMAYILIAFWSQSGPR